MSSTLKTYASFAIVHFICILVLFISSRGLEQKPLWLTFFAIGTVTLNIFSGYRYAYLYGKEEARRTAGKEEGEVTAAEEV
jgi:hypothetical protein